MQLVYLVLFLGLIAVLWVLFGALRRRRARLDVARATDELVRNRRQLEVDFCAAANVTGKPRGLIWKKCEFQNGVTLARDLATGELLGLVGVTISFDAVPGGGMEEVEAVSNLRAATAVLTWTGHHWDTSGRAIFNLEPHEVLEHYRELLDAVRDA